jgi:hypothetical protein
MVILDLFEFFEISHGTFSFPDSNTKSYISSHWRGDEFFLYLTVIIDSYGKHPKNKVQAAGIH